MHPVFGAGRMATYLPVPPVSGAPSILRQASISLSRHRRPFALQCELICSLLSIHLDVTMGAESIRPKIIKEAESIRLNVNIGDESIRMTVNMRAESTHLNAMMKTELIRGIPRSMRRRHGLVPVSIYVWGLYESSRRMIVNILSRCYSWDQGGSFSTRLRVLCRQVVIPN